MASIAPALRAYSGVGRAGFSPASLINQTIKAYSAERHQESSQTFADCLVRSDLFRQWAFTNKGVPEQDLEADNLTSCSWGGIRLCRD